MRFYCRTCPYIHNVGRRVCEKHPPPRGSGNEMNDSIIDVCFSW